MKTIEQRRAYRLANRSRIRVYQSAYTAARKAKRHADDPSRYSADHYLSLLPSPNLSVPETSYLAGFFDGEGCVGIYGGKRKNLELSIKVSGAHRASIERFARAFGGKVYVSHRRARTPREKTIWTWSIYSARAKIALGEMLPFLLVKKPEAFEALKCPVSRPSLVLSAADRDYKAVLAERIRALKRTEVSGRGPQTPRQVQPQGQ